MCGEHAGRGFGRWGAAGSSPLVRGAPQHARRQGDSRGIIPACAGSTVGITRMPARLPDHPRLCGEHFERSRGPARGSGSSPLVRGAPGDTFHKQSHHGIIPACAGSTLEDSISQTSTRDHPRLCGEHGRGAASKTCPSGSSPLVRGALAPVYRRVRGRGIIPACAGSTDRHPHGGRAEKDHPRLCGEHDRQGTELLRGTGSSPLVRGARLLLCVDGYQARIIPACAGSTPCSALRCPSSRDHPRLCGEHEGRTWRVNSR